MKKAFSYLLIAAIVLSGVSCGLSVFSIIMYFQLLGQYQTSLETLHQPQLLNFLRVEYIRKNTSYQLELQSQPLLLSKNDSTVVGWDYTYEKGFSLNATFKYIFLEINIPSMAFKHYQSVVCTWFVEENEGIITKKSFTSSSQFQGFYSCSQDISRYFWKDIVPNSICIEIKLRT